MSKKIFEIGGLLEDRTTGELQLKRKDILLKSGSGNPLKKRKGLILRRGSDIPPLKPSQIPHDGISTIDIASLGVFFGLHTISLSLKVDDIYRVVRRLQYLQLNPFVLSRSDKAIKVSWHSRGGNWYLSSGGRLSVCDRNYKYVSFGSRLPRTDGHLFIEFEPKWSFIHQATNLLPFSFWQRYYEEYFVDHIESLLDEPGLFNRSLPTVNRLDVAFDVVYPYPHFLISCLREVPFDKRIARIFTSSLVHSKSATKSKLTQFTCYYRGNKVRGFEVVRFELRRRRGVNVDRAFGLDDIRRTDVLDLGDYDLMRAYILWAFGKYRFYPTTPILPLHIAIERVKHRAVKNKLRLYPTWRKSNSASRKHRELRKQHNIVLGSSSNISREVVNLYEAFMAAFEASWLQEDFRWLD